MSDEGLVLKKRVVYEVPGMDKVRVLSDLVYQCTPAGDLKMDVYILPSLTEDKRVPGVIFVHGGPVPDDLHVKDIGQYVSWGQLVAASGMVGVTFNRRYSDYSQLPLSALDLSCAIDFVRQNAEDFNLDPGRLCLWACSGGGSMLSEALRTQPTYLRSMVIYYAYLDLCGDDEIKRQVGADNRHRYSPLEMLDRLHPLKFPIFMGRAGRDAPAINGTMDCFISRLLDMNANLEVMNHPNGQHGFDILDDTPRSREIIQRTLEFMKRNT